MLRSPRGPSSHAITAGAHAPSTQELSELDDAALLEAVGEGDEPAFGELFVRYADIVRRYARRTYGATSDVDDLVAEAFFRVLQSARREGGRIEHPQAYLLTVARRIVAEWARRRRDVPVDHDELAGRLDVTADRAAGSVERHLIARAFANLPERWRSVLWRVEVEGERPSVVGGYLGLSANATAALARRARDGLRAAYLQAHLADRPGPVSCRSVVTKLGAYTYGSVRGAERRRIRRHLSGCEACAALHAELVDVCSGLRAHASCVGPLIGAGTAMHHLATGSTWSAAAGSLPTGKAALGAGAKLAVLAGRAKLAIAATATAGVGVLGVATSGVLHDSAGSQALPGYDGGRGTAVTPVCTTCAASSAPAVVRSRSHRSTTAPRQAPVAGTAQSSAVGGSSTEAADRRRGGSGHGGSDGGGSNGGAAFDVARSRQDQQPRHAAGRGTAPGKRLSTAPESAQAAGGERLRSSELPDWVPPDTPADASRESGTMPSPATTASESTAGPAGPDSTPETAETTASRPGNHAQRSAGSGPHTYRLRSDAQPGGKTMRIHVALLPNRP